MWFDLTHVASINKICVTSKNKFRYVKIWKEYNYEMPLELMSLVVGFIYYPNSRQTGVFCFFIFFLRGVSLKKIKKTKQTNFEKKKHTHTHR